MTALEVGFLDSLAWRVDDLVHVVLHLADVPVHDAVEVRFRDGERRVRVAGRSAPAPEGSLVEVEVPARRLAGGLWRIAVRLDDAEAFTPVQARLLVRRGQPVALLPGPEPRTRLPEPSRGPELVSAGASVPRAFAVRVVGRLRRMLSR